MSHHLARIGGSLTVVLGLLLFGQVAIASGMPTAPSPNMLPTTCPVSIATGETKFGSRQPLETYVRRVAFEPAVFSIGFAPNERSSGCASVSNFPTPLPGLRCVGCFGVYA